MQSAIGPNKILLKDKEDNKPASERDEKQSYWTASQTHALLWGSCLVLALFLISIILYIWKCKRTKRKVKHTLYFPTTVVKCSGETSTYRKQAEKANVVKWQKVIEETEIKIENDGDLICSEQSYGRINYKLRYNFDTSTLAVTVVEAQDLTTNDIAGISDIFVEVYLLPDKKKTFWTKALRNTPDPIFNDTFYFQNITYAQMMSMTLVLAVFHNDHFSNNNLLGEVKAPLHKIDFAFEQEQWSDLIKTTAGKNNILGEICFSLRYIPTAGKLTVIVIEARNLKKMDIGGLSDPYVKISMNVNGKRIKKKKTRTKKQTLNPYYNESFVFDLPFEIIKKASLTITVVDYDRMSASDPIGEITLSHSATGAELEHWSEMLSNPRRSIARWHTLKYIVKGKKEVNISKTN